MLETRLKLLPSVFGMNLKLNLALRNNIVGLVIVVFMGIVVDDREFVARNGVKTHRYIVIILDLR